MMCELQTWIGAYVLDALEPEESDTVRVHISDCPICQDEMVSLAWIPTVLRNVSFDGVEGLDEPESLAAGNGSNVGNNGHNGSGGGSDRGSGRSGEHSTGAPPSPVMLERLLARMDHDQRSRRPSRPATLLVAAAAAAAIAGAATIASGAFDNAHRSPAISAIRAVDPATEVSAAVTMTGRTWGTELHLTLSWVAPGQKCSLIAHSRDGRSDVAATWTATYRGTADVPGTTAIPADQLSELDVVAANGKQLVRLVVPGKAK